MLDVSLRTELLCGWLASRCEAAYLFMTTTCRCLVIAARMRYVPLRMEYRAAEQSACRPKPRTPGVVSVSPTPDPGPPQRPTTILVRETPDAATCRRLPLNPRAYVSIAAASRSRPVDVRGGRRRCWLAEGGRALPVLPSRPDTVPA